MRFPTRNCNYIYLASLLLGVVSFDVNATKPVDATVHAPEAVFAEASQLINGAWAAALGHFRHVLNSWDETSLDKMKGEIFPKRNPDWGKREPSNIEKQAWTAELSRRRGIILAAAEISKGNQRRLRRLWDEQPVFATEQERRGIKTPSDHATNAEWQNWNEMVTTFRLVAWPAQWKKWKDTVTTAKKEMPRLPAVEIFAKHLSGVIMPRRGASRPHPIHIFSTHRNESAYRKVNAR